MGHTGILGVRNEIFRVRLTYLRPIARLPSQPEKEGLYGAQCVVDGGFG
jgi:hypothetical protein